MTLIARDVLIVGAGLAGAALAGRLARVGIPVVLVASHPAHPHEFRAEKFGAAAMAAFERLGLRTTVEGATTAFSRVAIGRRGRPMGCRTQPEHGFAYPAFVDALRAALPGEVTTIVGRVADLASGASRQRIELADGRALEGRLVVLATGLGGSLARRSGFVRTTLSRAHCQIFGFDLPTLALPAGAEALTWHGERPGDGVAYLTVFPLGPRLRANLFAHWDLDDSRAAAFAADPAAGLAALMPGLTRHLGHLGPTGTVQRRVADLATTDCAAREGIVAIGDAACIACPSTGRGIAKALADVETLAQLVPGWLASPGMGVAKTTAFAMDAAKTRSDAAALRASFKARRMLTRTDLATRVHRAGRDAVLRGVSVLRGERNGGCGDAVVGGDGIEPPTLSV